MPSSKEKKTSKRESYTTLGVPDRKPRQYRDCHQSPNTFKYRNKLANEWLDNLRIALQQKVADTTNHHNLQKGMSVNNAIAAHRTWNLLSV